jgi:predicted protein tyrosine phosphatase
MCQQFKVSYELSIIKGQQRMSSLAVVIQQLIGVANKNDRFPLTDRFKCSLEDIRVVCRIDITDSIVICVRWNPKMRR